MKLLDRLDAFLYSAYRTTCYVFWVLWVSATGRMTLDKAMAAAEKSIDDELAEQELKLRRQKLLSRTLRKL